MNSFTHHISRLEAILIGIVIGLVSSAGITFLWFRNNTWVGYYVFPIGIIGSLIGSIKAHQNKRSRKDTMIGGVIGVVVGLGTIWILWIVFLGLFFPF